MRRPSFIAGLILLSEFLWLAPASAEQRNAGVRTPPSVAAAQAAARESQRLVIEKLRSGQEAPDSYGLQCCQVLQVPASAFVPLDDAVPAANADLGYLYAAQNGIGFDFWAPVQLPTGARIVYLDLFYNDTNVLDDFQVDLRAFLGGNPDFLGSGPPSGSTIASVFSTGSAGYGYAVTELDYVVNNNVGYDPAAAQLTLRVLFTANAALSQGLKAVEIWWERGLSPAPATATFGDVPTNDFAFQYVEALVASGVTGGCQASPALYCPDNFVTRRQMAIFIAKALGLYWRF